MSNIKAYFQKNSNIKLFLILTFITSVFIRTVLGVAFGQMNVFYDELLHWNLSKSIYYNLGSNFRNDILSYKEILYSISLAFTHRFGNTEMQYYVAVGVNSVLMSSVIFPVFFMANRFLKNKYKAVIIAFLSIIIPEMAYTAKVIQENLYYPLVIWFFFFFIFLILRKPYNLRNMIFLGSYVFIISLCKQMALNIFAGVVLYYMAQFLFFDKGNKKRCIISISWFIAVFMGLKFCYGILFNLVNGITSVSSSEVTIGVILQNIFDPYLLSQLIYPALLYLLLSTLYFGFFPVLLPLSILNKLTKEERNLFLLVCTILVSTILVICLRIIPSENLNDLTIRFHFRYLFFLLIPLLILFLSIYPKIIERRGCIKLFVLSIIYLLLLNYINIIPAEGAKIDCVGANYIKYLFDSEMMVNTLYILIILGVFAGIYLLYKKKTKALYGILLTCFVISGVVSSCYTYSKFYVNKLESIEKKKDAFTLNSYFHDTLKSNMSSLLIISESKVSDAKLEVYLQYPNYYFCKKQDFNDFIEEYPGEAFRLLNLYSFNKQFNAGKLEFPEYIVSFESIDVDGYKRENIGLKRYYFYVKE